MSTTKASGPHPLDKMRQPGAVVIRVSGDLRDIEEHLRLIKRLYETRSEDVSRVGDRLKVYPRSIID